MTKDAAAYLWDARQAGERILTFVSGQTFERYATDVLLRSAVERQFSILGEAFAALRRTNPEVAAAIPALPQIVAFRNILVHGYAHVDDQRVWQAIESFLPALMADVSALLDVADRHS